MRLILCMLSVIWCACAQVDGLAHGESSVSSSPARRAVAGRLPAASWAQATEQGKLAGNRAIRSIRIRSPATELAEDSTLIVQLRRFVLQHGEQSHDTAALLQRLMHQDAVHESAVRCLGDAASACSEPVGPASPYNHHARERAFHAAAPSAQYMYWRVMPRNNLAASLPSDFVLIQVRVRRCGLAASPAVRDHPAADGRADEDVECTDAPATSQELHAFLERVRAHVHRPSASNGTPFRGLVRGVHVNVRYSPRRRADSAGNGEEQRWKGADEPWRSVSAMRNISAVHIGAGFRPKTRRRTRTRTRTHTHTIVRPELNTPTRAHARLDLLQSSKDVSSHSRTRGRAYASGASIPPLQIAHAYTLTHTHARGVTGAGVRVAVLDTGLPSAHPHFRNVRGRSNWTNEPTLDDRLGHGTFMAGVIGSSHPSCKGMAPDADLFAFRVFTSEQTSYTSWFLDALNYASALDVHVLSLSVGGPDACDRPLRDKMDELAAAGVVLVSAIGNDGPLYGTLNNPGDQPAVLGVGGANQDGSVAPFSSRGMTTWELPEGFGRVKPDVMAYAQNLVGSAIDGGCRTLSGTSVASPVVAGAAALLASLAPQDRRWLLLSPAAIKQSIIHTAQRMTTPALPSNPASGADVALGGHGPVADGASWRSDATVSPNMYEQGAGMLDVARAVEYIETYPVEGRVTVHPATLDLTDCPFAWPHCGQPLWFGAYPTGINLTIINGIGPAGYVLGLGCHAGLDCDADDAADGHAFAPVWEAGHNGDLLRVSVSGSTDGRIWPWTGALGISLEVVAPVPTSRHSENAVDERWDADVLVAEGTLVLRVKTRLSPEKFHFLTDEARLYHTIGDGTISVRLEDLRNQWWPHAVDDSLNRPPAIVSTVRVPIRVHVSRRTPPQRLRLLFDTAHNMRYPNAYVPRDAVGMSDDALDWNGDHPFTNFRSLWMHLRDLGYAVETAGHAWGCFDLRVFGTVLIVDPEEDFAADEIAAMQAAVSQPRYSPSAPGGWETTSLVLLADWYDPAVIERSVYHDDNTRSFWKPVTGGAHIPALNSLLAGFGVQFANNVYRGVFGSGLTALERANFADKYDKLAQEALSNPDGAGRAGDDAAYVFNLRPRTHIRSPGEVRHPLQDVLRAHPHRGIHMPRSVSERSRTRLGAFASGAALGAFPMQNAQAMTLPPNSHLHFAHLVDQSFEMVSSSAPPSVVPVRRVPVLGFLQTWIPQRGGRVVVYGDSTCVDDAEVDDRSGFCWWLLDAMLAYARDATPPPADLLGSRSGIIEGASVVSSGSVRVPSTDAWLETLDAASHARFHVAPPSMHAGAMSDPAQSTASRGWLPSIAEVWKRMWTSEQSKSRASRADARSHRAADNVGAVRQAEPMADAAPAMGAEEARIFELPVAAFAPASSITAADDAPQHAAPADAAGILSSEVQVDPIYKDALPQLEEARVRAGPKPTVGPHGYEPVHTEHPDAALQQLSRTLLRISGEKRQVLHQSHVHDSAEFLGGERSRAFATRRARLSAEASRALDAATIAMYSNESAAVNPDAMAAAWLVLPDEHLQHHVSYTLSERPMRDVIRSTCHPLGDVVVVAQDPGYTEHPNDNERESE